MQVLVKVFLFHIFIHILTTQTLPGQAYEKPNWEKQAVRIIFNEDRFCHSRPLLKTLNALNIYQLNICQNLDLMSRLKNDTILKIFTEVIKKPKYKYPTKFSKNSYISKSFSLSNMKYSMLWNEVKVMEWMKIQFYPLFHKSIKWKLIATENEVMHLWNDFFTF